MKAKLDVGRYVEVDVGCCTLSRCLLWLLSTAVESIAHTTPQRNEAIED